MKTFKSFLKEELLAENAEELLSEAKDDKTKVGGVSNNTKGVLHELLVGKELNNGKHMEKHELESEHPTKKGKKIRETPEAAHKRLKDAIHPDDYKVAVTRAKVAADAKRKEVETKGHKITKVVHTSKPGDTEKETNIPATQKQDRSDVYIHTKDAKGNKALHGVSLKASDNSSKNVPSSNLGMKSSGPHAEALHKEHQDKIKSNHPTLTKVKVQPHHDDIAAARKEWAKNNPKKHAQIKSENRKLLANVAQHHATHLQNQLNNGKHEQVVNHIRDVLGAEKTPAQKAGKATFTKSTVYKTAKGYQHHSSNPSDDHEHILNDPKNISVTHSGGSVHFHHTNPKTGIKKFATQTHKFTSQSDPLSTLTSSGKAT